jgi:hypothetical protein
MGKESSVGFRSTQFRPKQRPKEMRENAPKRDNAQRPQRSSKILTSHNANQGKI